MAAAFGVMTWFWQQGHGSSAIFGIPATGAITFWIPLMVFAFLFGLSMDYEVFILARVREEYDRTGSTDAAIVEGLGRTGRLVTSAALILFLAFASLASAPNTDIKVLATGLGVGILLDATIVRALLAPRRSSRSSGAGTGGSQRRSRACCGSPGRPGWQSKRPTSRTPHVYETRSDYPRRIMIAGGSGLIGRHLAAALLARGDEVLVLSRHPAPAQTHLPGCAVLRWHPGSNGRWQDELDVVDAVVDVSGAPFFTKWRGNYYKREVLGSRRTAIKSLIEAMDRASVRPKVFISTSSLGPYGFRRDDEVLTERSSPDIGPLSRDALELEACALEAEALGTRVVLLRPGVVLAADGGAFHLMTKTFGGLVAPVTPGTQWCSWIHIADAVELIISALDHELARADEPHLTKPGAQPRVRGDLRAGDISSTQTGDSGPSTAPHVRQGRDRHHPRPTRASRPSTRARTRVPLPDADQRTR